MPTAAPTRTDGPAAAPTARLRVEREHVREASGAVPLALRRLRDERDGVIRFGLVQTAAMLVDGDDVRLEIVAGPGAALVLRDISATLAHPMRGRASWCLHVSAARGSRVVIAEQPLVVAAGASLTRSVSIELEPGARLLHRETVVLGRHGERGGSLHARTRVTRDGRPVLDDTLDTADREARRSPAVLGAARVVTTASLFGCDVADRDGFALASGDRLMRRLGATAMDVADLTTVERAWSTAVLEPADLAGTP